jgi:hypothetical protein
MVQNYSKKINYSFSSYTSTGNRVFSVYSFVIYVMQYSAAPSGFLYKISIASLKLSAMPLDIWPHSELQKNTSDYFFSKTP